MIKVEVWLNDEVEVDLFGQLTAVLRQKRAAEQANYTSEPLTKRAAEPELAAPNQAEAETPAAPEDKSPVVGSITPAVEVAAPAAAVPSESEAADALRGYIAGKGVEAAVKLLGEFGVKRAGELAPEQRAAFIGKTKETGK